MERIITDFGEEITINKEQYHIIKDGKRTNEEHQRISIEIEDSEDYKVKCTLSRDKVVELIQKLTEIIDKNIE